MSDILKPCPFCGSAHITDRYVRDGKQIFCPNCGASARSAFHGPDCDTLERAAANWNTRAAPPAYEPMLAALEVLVDAAYYVSEHGKQRHHDALVKARAAAYVAIRKATGQAVQS